MIDLKIFNDKSMHEIKCIIILIVFFINSIVISFSSFPQNNNVKTAKIMNGDNTNVWTNGNGTNLWSDPLNWILGHKPFDNENVVFNSTSVANCDINENTASLNNFSILNGYTGTIFLYENLILKMNDFMFESGILKTQKSDKWILNGNLTYRGTANNYNAYALYLVMNGVNKKILVEKGFNIYRIELKNDTIIEGLSNIWFNGNNFITENNVTVENRIATNAAITVYSQNDDYIWDNRGTWTGTGRIIFLLYKYDVNIKPGNLSCPIVIAAYSAATSNRKFTIVANTTFENSLHVYSYHSTYRITLTTDSIYTLTVNGLTTVDTRATMLQGNSNWIFNGGLKISGTNSYFYQYYNIYINTQFSITNGRFYGNTNYFVYCSSNFSATNGIISNLNLDMNGQDKQITADSNYYSFNILKISANTIQTTNIDILKKLIIEKNAILQQNSYYLLLEGMEKDLLFLNGTFTNKIKIEIYEKSEHNIYLQTIPIGKFEFEILYELEPKINFIFDKEMPDDDAILTFMPKDFMQLNINLMNGDQEKKFGTIAYNFSIQSEKNLTMVFYDLEKVFGYKLFKNNILYLLTEPGNESISVNLTYLASTKYFELISYYNISINSNPILLAYPMQKYQYTIDYSLNLYSPNRIFSMETNADFLTIFENTIVGIPKENDYGFYFVNITLFDGYTYANQSYLLYVVTQIPMAFSIQIILIFCLVIAMVIIGYIVDTKFIIFAGLLLIFGGVIVIYYLGPMWLIFTLGLGFILLIEGGLKIFERNE